MKAFSWAWSHLVGEVLPNEQLEIWHEGRCARCNRKLTVPEDLEWARARVAGEG